MPIFEIPPNTSPSGTPERADSRPSRLGVEYSPVLLSQLEDDLARSCMREAFWISVVVHIVVILAVALSPKYMPSARVVKVATAEDMLKNKELTFLELPPDQQTPPAKPPDTRFMSDKNRIATSRAPHIDQKTLDELREARRSAPPGPPGPPQQAQSSAPNVPGTPGQSQPAPRQSQETASSNMPSAPLPPKPNPNPFSGAMSAGTAIAEAARSGARGGYAGAGGDFGLGPGGSQGKIRSNMDVLSDTMGVDFGPYLSRVLQSVRMNWYTLIPEVARAPLMKKGKVSIEFAILKDGKVAGLRLVGPSGDVSLDRAAWGGITASSPFSPLPGEFRGPYLALRFHFFYNPDKNDLQ